VGLCTLVSACFLLLRRSSYDDRTVDAGQRPDHVRAGAQDDCRSAAAHQEDGRGDRRRGENARPRANQRRTQEAADPTPGT